MNTIKQKKIILPVLLIIACVLFNLVISLHYFHTTLSSDENLYHTLALSIVKGKTTADLGHLTIDIGQEVTPFYSLFVAFAYSLSPSLISLIVFQIILSCGVIILLFSALNLIIRNKLVQFLAVFAFIFYFPLWAYNFYVMMEIYTVFLLSLIIFLLSIYFKNPNKNYYYLSSSIIIFGFLVLVNNRFIVLFGALILFLFISIIGKNIILKKALFFSLLVVIVMFSLWFARQHQVYNRVVFFTPLWHNVLAEKVGLWDKVIIKSQEDHSSSIINRKMDYDSFRKSLNDKSNSITNYITKSAFDEMIVSVDNKNIYIARLERYFNIYDVNYKFLYPNDYRLISPSSIPFRIIQLVIFLPMLVFGVFGVVVAFRNSNILVVLFTLLLIAHLLLHVAIHYIDRYRLTALPLLFIISVYGMDQFYYTFIEKKIASLNNTKIFKGLC